MIRILLLDCSASLEKRLRSQGFDVESGTVGFFTGTRFLPSQVYEKLIFVYDPTLLLTLSSGKHVEEKDIRDSSPEYSLGYLEARILAGATFLVFVNRLSEDLQAQNVAYSWIPFMPSIFFTKDKLVRSNTLRDYPDSNCSYLLPLLRPDELDIPVLQKIEAPRPQDYPRDVFWLFCNGRGDDLGVYIRRGKGGLIVLPKFKSNEDVTETFLNRVLPKMYDLRARSTLVERYLSPAEHQARTEISQFEATIKEKGKLLEDARVKLATAAREKTKIVANDPVAKQILIYYDEATKQDDVALFYLFKIIESIEHKFGGETDGINALGLGSEWKYVKKIANASYGDARHAPKPGDVIHKWSDAEIKQCFEATEKVALAYFGTLFR